ncbi:preprotein translocase subunit YajC [Lachnospiraceae bacterium NK3A20]|jgi:preprotein translocase subunit YajC|nr:preprotein translocase subunit YajC [Lachnospiraceae bacterium NK3A20]
MNSALLLTNAAGSTSSVGGFTIIYLVIIVLFFYFFFIRPQRKEQKQKDALLSALEVGDSVLTSAGFYGVVIDIADDTVIVEFGNNKNCRIPMQKNAIIQVEKPEDAAGEEAAEDKKDTKVKK